MRRSYKKSSPHDTGTTQNTQAQQRPRADTDKYRYMPQNLAAEFSRRILEWLYSFSLVILMLLTLAFVVATPADVITQTLSTQNNMPIKLFIIFICNAFFLLMCMVYYFTRLVHIRIIVHQVPSKSVYVPLEKNDLPKKSQSHIIKNLKRCMGDIKPQAGPLEHPKETFDYPGMSPPYYIQQRNINLGLQAEVSGFPENCVFQDVINSIGLKLRVEGLLAGNYMIPKHYTFREVMLAIAEELVDEQLFDEDLQVVLRRVVGDYERLKFGPDLAKQHEIMQFLANLERLLTKYVNSAATNSARDEVISEVSKVVNPTFQRYPSSQSGNDAYGGSSSSSDDGRPILGSRRGPNFLNPFDYDDDSGSLKRRSFSNSSINAMGRISRWSTRSRDQPRKSADMGSDKDLFGERQQRRGSQWSMIKSRFGDAFKGDKQAGDNI